MAKKKSRSALKYIGGGALGGTAAGSLLAALLGAKHPSVIAAGGVTGALLGGMFGDLKRRDPDILQHWWDPASVLPPKQREAYRKNHKLIDTYTPLKLDTSLVLGSLLGGAVPALFKAPNTVSSLGAAGGALLGGLAGPPLIKLLENRYKDSE